MKLANTARERKSNGGGWSLGRGACDAENDRTDVAVGGRREGDVSTLLRG